jgi:hypothetical protein
MNQDPFSFLPRDEVLFLDTCVFSLSGKDSRDMGLTAYHDQWAGQDREIILEELARLNMLERRLREWNNWVVTDEIIEEFQRGNQKLGYRSRDKRSPSMGHALYSLLCKREKTIRLLESLEKSISNPDNQSSSFESDFQRTSEYVAPIFLGYGGNLTNLNADIGLISGALVYAQSSPTYIFSHDYPLLRTFAECAVAQEGFLEPTYVCLEDSQVSMDTNEFFELNKHRKDNSA